MNVKLVCVFCVINVYTAFTQNKGEYNNQIIDGYRPIWFDLGQKNRIWV